MGSRRSTLSLLAALTAVVVALLLSGCGGAGSGQATAAGAQRGAPHRGTIEERLVALERGALHDRRVTYLERVRDAVVRGMGMDFADGTGIGGPPFEACVKGLLREALDGPTISNLVAVYRRPGGVAYAAQALNALAAPLAADCGHRYWVPELVDTARGLRSGRPIGAATRVVAVVGGQQIHLRTPGEHNRITNRDWVGTFTKTGIARGHDSANRSGDLLYVGVELRVRFADDRRVHALFPHVLVSSGWG
ncbi:MAG TPA: hypothetical protein VGH14_17925 [Solirubrobacterales bacterium]|jgi:hypothetical protein